MAGKRQLGRNEVTTAGSTGAASQSTMSQTTMSQSQWKRSGYIEGNKRGAMPRPWFKRWGWWLLPLTALGLVAGTVWGVRHIEGDIEQAAPEILRQAGIDPTGLEFDATYRNLEVSGVLPAGTTASQIETLLEEGEGPADGEDIREATITATDGAPAEQGVIAVNAKSDGETITLEGTVPSQAHADELLAAAEASGATVVNNLTVSGLEPSAADANGQIGRLAAVLPSLGAGVASADLTLSDTDLTGSIDAADADAAAALAGIVGAGVLINGPDAEPTGNLNVQTTYDGTTIVLNGEVLTEAHAAELEAAAVEAVGAENVVNNLTVLGLDSAVDGADAKVSALAQTIGTFPGLVTAQATMTDTDLTLSGTATSPEAAAATNAAAAQAAAAGLNVGAEIGVEEAEATVEEEIELLQAELDSLQDEIRENVVFASDSAELTDVAKGTLDKVVAAMDRYQRPVVETGGHTDSQGSDDYNLELSQRRSDSVVAYLVVQGIAPDRLQPVGFGESQPVATNDTDEGRLENRRVEFIAKDAF